MCRNIRPLHNFEPAATSEEVHDAALQFVRKISGSTQPAKANDGVLPRAREGRKTRAATKRAKANEEVFGRAVEEIAASAERLLDGLVTNAPPKDREVEAAKARARAQKRYAGAAA